MSCNTTLIFAVQWTEREKGQYFEELTLARLLNNCVIGLFFVMSLLTK